MSDQVDRVMGRCVACGAWWSVYPDDPGKCGCGSDIKPVDMVAHIASLPKKAYDLGKDSSDKDKKG